MKIRVIKSMTPDCWYSGCVNQVFHVFGIQGSPFVHFTQNFLFYPGDYEFLGDKSEGYMPHLLGFGKA